MEDQLSKYRREGPKLFKVFLYEGPRQDKDTVKLRYWLSFSDLINSKETKVKSCLKRVDYAQGQGVDLGLKRSVHAVREHLKLNRNAAIERKMHF